jgi:signal recognition particle receptor subunit beta
MAVIVVADRELHAKIVYYGPGLSGKTTNLAWIYEHLPMADRSDLVSIDTEHERTLFFDFLPIDINKVGDFQLRLHLYTVPGQDRFAATRSAILRGVDGVVFVADAQRDRVSENQKSFDELKSHLTKQGRSIEEVPLVYQYNKSDLTTALTKAQLDAYHNPNGVPSLMASAVNGQGVVETLGDVIRDVVRKF